MEIKRFDIGEHNIEFVNESANTRHGFKHITHMFVNGCNIGTHTSYYLNRTWECYRYQTVMRGCVYDIIEERTENLKSIFKSERGYKNLTAKRAEEFDKFIADDEELKLYNEILERLKA